MNQDLTRTVRQLPIGYSFQHYLLPPLNYLGPGLSSFMNILRLYAASVWRFISTGSFVKEEFVLQDNWIIPINPRTKNLSLLGYNYFTKSNKGWQVWTLSFKIKEFRDTNLNNRPIV